MAGRAYGVIQQHPVYRGSCANVDANADTNANVHAGTDPETTPGEVNDSRSLSADVEFQSMPMHKFTACSRCHAKKIKCSGGKPCQGCRQSDVGDACSYPERNRTVKVKQRFLDKLCEEIKQLRQQQQQQSQQQQDNIGSISSNKISSNKNNDGNSNNSKHRTTRLPIEQQQQQRPGNESSRSQEVSSNGAISQGDTSPRTRPVRASMSVAGAEPGTEEVEEDLDMSTMPLSYSRAQGSWFDNRNVFQTAVLIGETADTAFATRFRQTIADPQAPEPPHLLRLDYFTDEALTGLTQSPVAWPCPSQARFLVEAALKYLARCHYLVQREVVTGVQGTEMAMNPGRGTPELRAKFWVLFALGELCSARSLPSDGYPGVHYYAQATKLLGQLKERPGLDFIETLLMLSLYSLALNRRHSAYMYVGTAMRSAVIMGLHLSVPQHQLPDLFAREHRKRLFWTTYAYDRRWAALLNLPPAIHDAVIEVEYPSNSDVEVLGSVEADPGTCCSLSSTSSHDTEHKVASIQLSRLLSGVVDSVYGLKNRNKDTQLPTRVQRALDDLQEWNEHLPPSLQISKAGQGQDNMEAVSLRLSFYQCVILATRPMLLYSLRLQADQAIQSSRTVEPDATDAAVSATNLPATAVALSAACVRCARHSAYLLTQSWIEGSFATFDCFFTHYLFSSATILAVSSLLGSKDSASDRDMFDQAAWLLKKLQEAGNCVAQEYCNHVQAMQAAMVTYLGNVEPPSSVETASFVGGSNAPGNANFQPQLPQPAGPQNLDPTATGSGIPWTEPSLSQLLSQPALDVQFLEAAISNGFSQGPYWSDNG